jgi:TonB family protein
MAVADVRHASPNSQTVGTAVSLGAHGILFGILLFGIARAPGVRDTVAVRIEQFHPEFLNKPGPGATGTSSGSGVTDPPRRTAVNDVPRVSFVDIPVTMLEPVQIIPGVPAAIDAESLGRGRGPAAGGVGDREGPGFGRGGRGGSGDDEYGSGGGATSPILIREVKPAYSVDAMRAKLQGTVELEVVVLADGSVDPNRIRVVRSLDSRFGLDEQAVAAVKQWVFRPGMRDKRPVPVRVAVELTFTLR